MASVINWSVMLLYEVRFRKESQDVCINNYQPWNLFGDTGGNTSFISNFCFLIRQGGKPKHTSSSEQDFKKEQWPW